MVALSCFLSANAQKQVAVYVSGDQEEGVKKVLGSKMVTYITNADGFTAVERTKDFLNALMNENDYQTSGEVSNSQIVRLGQRFGARYVAAVDVSDVFGELFVSARLIDVLTGAVESSYESSSQANNMPALTSLANNIADGLILGPIRKQKEKEQAERERQRQIAENQRAQLRQRAINNLMPNGATQMDGKIIMSNPIPVQFYLDTTDKVKIKFNLPSGFRIADVLFLKNLSNKNLLQKEYGSYYYLTSDAQPHPTGKFKYASNEGLWAVPYVTSPYMYSPSNFDVAETKKQNGRLRIVWQKKGTFYVVAYRDFFSESEIQAEMNRISR